MKRRIITVLCLFALLPGSRIASAIEPPFQWDVVSDADWKSDRDRDPVPDYIIFEKILVDDATLTPYTRVYRRFRIQSADGLSAGDVNLPFVSDKTHLLYVDGRSIDRQGRITRVTADDVVFRDVLSAKGITIKRPSIHFPGLTADCLFEYVFSFKSRSDEARWDIQRDVPVKHWELRWRPHQETRGRNPTDQYYARVFNTPLYEWAHTDKGRFTRVAEGDYSGDVVFELDDVPAYRNEVYSGPESSHKIYLRCFYGFAGPAWQQWDILGHLYRDGFTYFWSHSKRLEREIRGIEKLGTPEAIVDSTYSFVTKRLKVIDWNETGRFGTPAESIDKLILRGEGSQIEINSAFCCALRQLGLKARMALVADRDEQIFSEDSKRWQISRSLVAVKFADGTNRFYSPGDPLLSCGGTCWFNETVPACVIEDDGVEFVTVPVSPAERNLRRSDIRLNVAPATGTTTAAVSYRYTGHEAWYWRMAARGDDREQRRLAATKQIRASYRMEDVDSVRTRGIADNRDTLQIDFSGRPQGALSRFAGRWELQPFAWLEPGLELPADTVRTYDVELDFARMWEARMEITIPAGWEAVDIPADSTLANSTGSAGWSFERKGSSVVALRWFKLTDQFRPRDRYGELVALDSVFRRSMNCRVVLAQRK